ncbi:conserved Plasmodium protein, unknown function [Plasmodium yoelii]|nr:conserved Plasmodium protein, unknown function [Plasmodium yoelii]CDU17149.1 conserved Plasmodium protein, unknown function [Plasmodium yoelii]VTZ76237.1 conserved Plasmodium protein, unknown function [Plasmodium yoelii]|eukprot:XP_729101.2 conserved Plasmodium protein, unknown function [Plasmodium yoelii]
MPINITLERFYKMLWPQLNCTQIKIYCKLSRCSIYNIKCVNRFICTSSKRIEENSILNKSRTSYYINNKNNKNNKNKKNFISVVHIGKCNISEKGVKTINIENTNDDTQNFTRNSLINMISEIKIGDINNEEKIYSFLSKLLNKKYSKESFLNLLSLTEFYKTSIIYSQKNILLNKNIINNILNNINFIIKNKDYNYMFKCFELMCIYKISNLKIFQKIIYFILKYNKKDEEKIITMNYIITYLYNNKIYDKLICILLVKYIFSKDNYFFNFLKNQNNIKHNFLSFIIYITKINDYFKELQIFKFLKIDNILKIYSDYFCYEIKSNLNFINNIKDIIILQNIFLKWEFYDYNFYLLIKEYINYSLTYLNISNVLHLMSNMLLTFTTNDRILFDHQNISVSNLKKIEKNKTHNNSSIPYVNHNYKIFLSNKYLIDSIIRTIDHNISNNTHDIDSVLKYITLSSYSHFMLYHNWWLNTNIYDKLKWKNKRKNKKNNIKALIQSKLPFKNHFNEKISYLLNIVLIKYNSINTTNNINNKFENNLSQFSNHENDFISNMNINYTPLINNKYLPYIFKTFIRASLFDYNLIKNEKFCFFFENLFTECVNSYISLYENHDKNIIDNIKIEENNLWELHPNNNNFKIQEENILKQKMNKKSLYEISSICECFFLLKYFQQKNKNKTIIINTQINIPNDIFENNLYIFLDRINRMFFNNKLNNSDLNRHYIHNILFENYLNHENYFFNYYLLLRILLPLIFNNTLEECLKITKQVIAHIISLPFVKKLLQLPPNIISNSSNYTNNINNTDLKLSNELIFKRWYKWENNIITINNKRKIRKKIKEKMNMLDFIQAGEFIRPTYIYILCLYKISKSEYIFEYFLKDISKIYTIQFETAKNKMTNFIHSLYEEINISTFNYITKNSPNLNKHTLKSKEKKTPM